MRVLVIGAGLGGLSLAHGLRAAGVDVAVHERSSRSGPQPASYGIHVDGHGNRALHACLPAENWAMYDESTTPAPDVVRFRDPSLEVLTDLSAAPPPTSPTRSPTGAPCAGRTCTGHSCTDSTT